MECCFKNNIVICLKEAKFSSSKQPLAKIDADDPVKWLVKELNNLREIDLNVVQEEVPKSHYLN